MTAPLIGADLLDLADELVRTAVRRVLGDDPAHADDWQIACRWYSHNDVKVVSDWMLLLGGPRLTARRAG